MTLGLTNNPRISLSLAARCGWLESLNRRKRCGQRPCVRDIRCTKLTPIPALAIPAPFQWLAARAVACGRSGYWRFATAASSVRRSAVLSRMFVRPCNRRFA